MTGPFAPQTLALVALGGALGCVLRYLAVVGAARAFGTGFPWGTLAVNVAGSFVMGLLFIYLTAKGLTRFSPLLLAGVLGGFTTFSAYSLDALILWERGQAPLAALYAGASVALSVAAVAAGAALMRGWLA